MIPRLLLLFALGWLAYRVWQVIERRQMLGRQPPPQAFEPMARCGRCGVYLPAAALSARGLCGKCSE